jgi:chromate reductase, NAD(P)H dehydrogenase (quinone)
MFSLARAHQMLDETPRLMDERLQERFERTIEAFLDLVEADTHYACQKKAWYALLGEHPDPAIDREELQP